MFPKVALICLIILPIALQAGTLSVQVKQTILRAKPSFLGKAIAKLSYAQKVQETSLKNGWYFVKSLDSGIKGWVHSSALSAKTIALSSSDKVSNTDVSQSEVLMAGKGFNKQVEEEYKKKNNSLNFSLVDKIERSNPVSRKSLNSFVNYGKLKI